LYIERYRLKQQLLFSCDSSLFECLVKEDIEMPPLLHLKPTCNVYENFFVNREWLANVKDYNLSCAAKNSLPIADCRLPIADCRLPIADCRLPIVYCRLPIADCRLSIALLIPPDMG
jgi:hypothetical protein